jgi:hypothetical protein
MNLIEDLNKKLSVIQRIIEKSYPFILEIKYNEAKKVTLFVDVVFDYTQLTTEYLNFTTREMIWSDYSSLGGIFDDEENREIGRKFSYKIENEINQINELLPKGIYKIPYIIAINYWFPSRATIPPGRRFLEL